MTVYTNCSTFRVMRSHPSGSRDLSNFTAGHFPSCCFWFNSKRSHPAERRAAVFGYEQREPSEWAPWSETLTQPWGCTDGLFILGSLWPLSLLSLEDENSCLVSCWTTNGAVEARANTTQSHWCFTAHQSGFHHVIKTNSRLSFEAKLEEKNSANVDYFWDEHVCGNRCEP